MGPEAGLDGGQIVFTGTPEALVEYSKPQRKSSKNMKTRSANSEGETKLRSYTAEALAPVLKAGPHQERLRYQENLPSTNSDAATAKETN
jgi:hypothetical protein